MVMCKQHVNAESVLFTMNMAVVMYGNAIVQFPRRCLDHCYTILACDPLDYVAYYLNICRNYCTERDLYRVRA